MLLENLKTILTGPGYIVHDDGTITWANHGKPEKKINAVSVEAAIISLAAICDHASTWDGAGFSAYDAKFGHSLAAAVWKYGKLTPGQFASCVMKPKGLLWKYRSQLTYLGFDVEELLALPAPVPSQKMKDIPVRIKIRPTKASDKAVLAQIAGQEALGEIWFPKSQMTFLNSDETGDTVEIPGWLARKNNISMVMRTPNAA